MGFHYELSGAEALEVLLPVYAVSLSISLLLSLMLYIFNGIALMRIARRRGLTNSWLAWIPFCSGYALGKISDDINFKRGKITGHRKVLLAMTICSGVLMAIGIAVIFVGIGETLEITWEIFKRDLIDADYLYRGIDVDRMLTLTLLGTFIILVGAVFAVIQLVFTYVAQYAVYKAYSPNNAVLFVVLSIFLNGIAPIFLFAVRNKLEVLPMSYYPQGGYPPYQSYNSYPPNQQPYQNYQSGQYGNGYQQYGQPQPYQTYQPNPNQGSVPPQQPEPAVFGKEEQNPQNHNPNFPQA